MIIMTQCGAHSQFWVVQGDAVPRGELWSPVVFVHNADGTFSNICINQWSHNTFLDYDGLSGIIQVSIVFASWDHIARSCKQGLKASALWGDNYVKNFYKTLRNLFSTTINGIQCINVEINYDPTISIFLTKHTIKKKSLRVNLEYERTWVGCTVWHHQPNQKL